MVVFSCVAGSLYNLLFSRYDKKLARKGQENLARDIQSFLPFVFEMGGRIVPNEGIAFPPPFDYAVVTVDLSDLLLRFSRGRDHLAVQIAPTFAPNNWHELSTVLSIVGVPGIRRGEISDLSQAAQLLRQNMMEVTRVLTEEQYPRLKTQLGELYARDRATTKQLEREINRNLYS